MKWFNRIIFAIIFASIIYLAYNLVTEQNLLKRNQRFTIGKVTKIKSRNFKYYYIFEYRVNNLSYSGLEPSNGLKLSEVLNKEFYVCFYPPDPDISELLFEFPVLDTFAVIPDNGWETIPY